MSTLTESHHQEIAELLPDFVAGALNDADLWRVEAHLESCEECQAEFDALLDVAALLGPLQTPLPSTRAALFERAGVPLPAPAAGVPPAPSVRTIRRRPLQFPIRTIRTGGPAWAALSAAVIALIVLGTWSFGLQQQLDEREDTVALLSDPDAAFPLNDSEVDTGATATFYVDPQRSEALLRADDLPALGESERYQVWLFTETGERVDGGTFGPEDDGSAVVTVEADVPFSTYWAVGVSVEPADGSDAPTTPLILGGWIQ